jgi:hypothetical protein
MRGTVLYRPQVSAIAFLDRLYTHCYAYAKGNPMIRSHAMDAWLVASLVVVSGMSCQPSLKAAGDPIDSKKARAFSDSLVALIIADKPAAIWRKMEARFRRELPETRMRTVLDQVYAQYGGQPLEAEFKSEAAGQKIYLEGTSKPMRKFWYSVRTTTQAKGKYFLFVEVVPDEGSLACTGFSIVTFSGGPPPEFR